MSLNLRKHQIDAINSFKKHYYVNMEPRGILSMCCGSGKTLTFYSIIKSCILEQNEGLFIYATSRILLVQSIVADIFNWCYQDKLNLLILVKVSKLDIDITGLECQNKYKLESDKKKFRSYFQDNKKNIILLGDENSISDTLISRYLHNKNKIVIITTYDSSIKIINAISECNKDNEEQITPDLLVLDESHNLVSEEKIKTANYLLERNEEKIFNPLKYLFMTATPLKMIRRNKNSTYTDEVIKFSMDNKDIYGDIFYEYSFYNGIRDRYIVDFNVVYLNENNDMDDDTITLIKSYNKEEEQQLYFTTVGKLLLKQIAQYNLKHTIVYISNQKKVKILENILNQNKTNHEIYYVISDQTEKDKRDNIDKFKKYNGYSKILLSVDIFNEGTDIPICDSILFAEERNSETVIVQNIGRALRLYNENGHHKEKAYIILPTKVYLVNENEISADLINTTYSSKFKKIREICDILKEPSNDTIYYKRKTKGTGTSFTNKNEDDNIEQLSELVDNVILASEDGTEIQTEIKQLTEEQLNSINQVSDKLVENFNIDSSNDKIANLTFDKLKKIIIDYKIISFKSYIDNQSNLSLIDPAHIQFKSEWICYGDLIYSKTYSYNEAIEIIKTLNLTQINNAGEWQEYYNDIINKALRNEYCDFDLLDKLIYIPYNPKTFYLENWKTDENDGWNTFLSKKLSLRTGFELEVKKGSVVTNSKKNLDNLINSDKSKIKELIPAKWQTFDNYKTDLTDIKQYINMKFDIDCEFTVRFILNKNLIYDGGIIWVKISKISNNYIPPITIDPSYKISFDKDIYDKNIIMTKIDIKRNQYEFIHNKNHQEIIKNLFLEIKKFISNQKINPVITFPIHNILDV